MSVGPKQSVFRVRRVYNQWVNNQTLEDFALRFTAKRARRFSFGQLANTALGSISFLALEAIGAAITLNYGFANAAAAIVLVSAIIFLLAVPLCYHAATSGLDIDLLTRGAGFGYIGSTITSLIYASFTFIFFALETAIMASALKWVFGLPLFIGYVVCALVVIPLVTHGITFISRFQRSTQLLWLVLHITPLVFLLFRSPEVLSDWVGYGSGEVNMHHLGAAGAIIFALVAQIGEQVDYLRFMPEKTAENRKKWWLTLLSAGPGWAIIGAIKMLIGSLLATLAIGQGLSPSDATDPTRMYAIAFEYVIPIEQLSIIIAAVFVVVSQLKINVTNAYAGSIAWSNFFSRLTHSHPGRVVWLVFNVAIALILMELGIYQAFEHILSGYGLLAIAWLGAVVGDLAISKPLGISPKRIEFIRAYLYAINPVGIGAMTLAVIVGLICYTGHAGATLKPQAHFITLIVALLAAPCIALLTGARFYIARPNLIITEPPSAKTRACCICENHFEPEDLAHCPAYEGAICSLCCSLDARCDDVCKPKSHRFAYQIERFKQVLPASLQEFVSERLAYFLGLMLFAMLISGSLLAVIYVNAVQFAPSDIAKNGIRTVLLQTFFVLQIALGVVAWLFVLANSSRRVAVEETRIQTLRLMDEIAAHDETDRQLQKAKEQAEAANKAKSRYLTGLSHELRTPLNSVLGYAQLLEQNPAIANDHQRQIAVIKRSAEHLSDLIEGLLDISKIEAGRLDIHRNQVAIGELIEQLGYMFRPQALSKGLEFNIVYLSALPKLVTTDEKRLRQILINLLSNAIKYTHQGAVDFMIRYRNQVAEFTIADTGIGIPSSERERIFKPFERVRTPGVPQVTGTGLGLTITRLLVDIMGGDLQLEDRCNFKSTKPLAEAQSGTVFTVSLMLSSIQAPAKNSEPAQIISGYTGERKSVLVLDDDPFHRGFIFEALNPLGFSIFEAPDIDFAKTHLLLDSIDLFLLDVNLPDGSGWEFAKSLRERRIQAPIIMVSADAEEGYGINDSPHNAYLIKPLKITALLDQVQQLLKLNWQFEPAPVHDLKASNTVATALPAQGGKVSIPTQAINSGALHDKDHALYKTIKALGNDERAQLKAALLTVQEHADNGDISQLRSALSAYTAPQSANPYAEILSAISVALLPMAERFELVMLAQILDALIYECHTP